MTLSAWNPQLSVSLEFSALSGSDALDGGDSRTPRHAGRSELALLRSAAVLASVEAGRARSVSPAARRQRRVTPTFPPGSGGHSTSWAGTRKATRHYAPLAARRAPVASPPAVTAGDGGGGENETRSGPNTSTPPAIHPPGSESTARYRRPASSSARIAARTGAPTHSRSSRPPSVAATDPDSSVPTRASSSGRNRR